MDPVRSSLASGFVATVVLLLLLLVADAFFAGTNLFVYTTFTSLCAVGGEPYCSPTSTTAALLTYVWFVLIFAIAWPLLFAGFTWGLPGDSGFVHGAVYGFILWVGYVVVVVYGIEFNLQSPEEGLSLLVITFVVYLVYGLILGGGYDFLAEHRTFLDEMPPG